MTSKPREFIKACRKGDLDLVKSLLQNKADINCKNDRGIVNASYSGNLELVKFLIENKADILNRENKSLVEACDQGHLEIAKFLIENKADIRVQEFSLVCDSLRNKNKEILKFLMESGLKFPFSRVILDMASRISNISCVEYLMSIGFNDENQLSPRMKSLINAKKYFRKWRKIIFKSYIRKVVTPLYYSPGFPGYLKAKNNFEDLIN